MKKKLVSILTMGAFLFSLITPIATNGPKVEAETIANWNVERYGDRVDIDGKLNQLSKDTLYLQQAEKSIKEQLQKLISQKLHLHLL